MSKAEIWKKPEVGVGVWCLFFLSNLEWSRSAFFCLFVGVRVGSESSIKFKIKTKNDASVNMILMSLHWAPEL